MGGVLAMGPLDSCQFPDAPSPHMIHRAIFYQFERKTPPFMAGDTSESDHRRRGWEGFRFLSPVWE